MQVYERRLDTPMGPFRIVSSSQGILAVQLPGADLSPRLEKALSQNLLFIVPCTCPAMEQAAEELRLYFDRHIDVFRCPIDHLLHTPFERDVYTALQTIPAGQRVSYGQLATMSGHGGKARAIGGAVGRNSIPIILPCHRIVAGNGQLGGWSGPMGMKQRLLKWEDNF